MQRAPMQSVHAMGMGIWPLHQEACCDARQKCTRRRGLPISYLPRPFSGAGSLRNPTTCGRLARCSEKLPLTLGIMPYYSSLGVHASSDDDVKHGVCDGTLYR